MSKNRLDKKIREVLEQRTLTPSEGSWQAIEDQLDPPIPSRRRGLAWYAIAAGFIGILWVAFYLPEGGPTVESPVERTVGTDSGPEKIKTPDQEQIMPSLTDAVVALPDEEVDSPVNDESLPEVFPSEKKPEAVAMETADEKMWTPEKLELKVAEVVAQVALLEDRGVAVEDRVIDSLLRAAREQVWKEQIADADQRVDAMALLSDVEGELNRSLRDQLFEKLKEGYLKVRDVVAYRNE